MFIIWTICLKKKTLFTPQIKRRRPGHIRDTSREFKARVGQDRQGKRKLQDRLLHLQQKEVSFVELLECV